MNRSAPVAGPCWLTNLALLFGAELDAELERGRELQAGIAAEESVQLPPRDTSKIKKDEKKHQEYVDEGREIRRAHSRPDTPEKTVGADDTAKER